MDDVAAELTDFSTRRMSSTITIQTAAPTTCEAIASLAGVPGDALVAAYACCAQVVRTRARNFYYGLRLTPEPRRSAIYSIYAWMRAADDIADSRAPIDERRTMLRTFAEHTEALLHGGAPAGDDPLWIALGATIACFRVPSNVFRDMLAGLEDDLAARPVLTDTDLDRYCYRVASTAGLACLAIWGLRPGVDADEAERLAVHRGQAFQRTNILRDFAQDFDDEPRRVYIPAAVFARHGITPEDLRTWKNEVRCRELIAAQAAVARSHYEASAALESMVSADCAPTLWAMTRIYSGLLEIIESDPARIVSTQRVRLSGPGKAAIAIRAAWGARRGWWRA
jgi:phytoene synthase